MTHVGITAVALLMLATDVTVLVLACRTSEPLTAAQISNELVEAGCLQAGAGDVDAVAAEMATGHDAWLTCLQGGGSIASCNVPCAK
jgi:hypothetical protein